jgi:hypothetical protein
MSESEIIEMIKLFQKKIKLDETFNTEAFTIGDFVFNFKIENVQFCCICFDKDDFEKNKFKIGYDRMWGITNFFNKLEELEIKDDFLFYLEEQVLMEI